MTFEYPWAVVEMEVCTTTSRHRWKIVSVAVAVVGTRAFTTTLGYRWAVEKAVQEVAVVVVVVVTVLCDRLNRFNLNRWTSALVIPVLVILVPFLSQRDKTAPVAAMTDTTASLRNNGNDTNNNNSSNRDQAVTTVYLHNKSFYYPR